MIGELDLLKKDWKRSENSFEQVSEVDIYKMLHKKSSSIVKWILIICILEVLFWTSINVFYNTDEVFNKNFSPDIAKNIIQFNQIFTILNYFVVAIFIYMFYKNYKQISTISSTKKLMSDILNARRTVNFYVWYNLIMISIGVIVVSIIQFLYSPKMEIIREKLSHDSNHLALLKLVGMVSLMVVGFVFIFWLFYKLLYGILLRKLNRNYKELKKIEL